MFLPKDHAAFEIDRKRLAVWADIRHLQWGFAQRREYGELRQHGRTLQRKWLALFYIGVNPRFDEFVAPKLHFLSEPGGLG